MQMVPAKAEITITSLGLFVRAVQAFNEALGMHAENQWCAIREETPLYSRDDFVYLSHKYELDNTEVDELLSKSEQEFVNERKGT